MVFEPTTRFKVRLQMAVPEPVVVSAVARTPFTVTDEIPLSPRPESVAVPDNVIELVETVWPLLWLVITIAGPVESTGGALLYNAFTPAMSSGCGAAIVLP